MIRAVSEGTTAAVLFAEVIGGAALYAGDARGAAAVDGCLQALREATRSAGGEVVKTIGDEVMAAFSTADAAANAAARMHLAVDALPRAGGKRLELRVGFHAGPVIRRDNDLFGVTVNVAARLVGQAAQGQILTSRETAELLSPAVRSSTRVLYRVEVKGKSDSVELCELLWQQSADITDVASHASAPTARLRVRHGGREMQVPDGELTIGRDRECDVIIDDEHVSRRHCTIHQRHGKSVVQDHSANGTYVTVEGEAEIALQRDDYVLRGHGWIAFGQPRSKTAHVLEFFCD